eukprot:m.292977 g.292977  ORF g.292977 m.292977 type:complete len:155 (-) comp55119_c0_seq4:549-1013(-)
MDGQRLQMLLNLALQRLGRRLGVFLAWHATAYANEKASAQPESTSGGRREGENSPREFQIAAVSANASAGRLAGRRDPLRSASVTRKQATKVATMGVSPRVPRLLVRYCAVRLDCFPSAPFGRLELKLGSSASPARSASSSSSSSSSSSFKSGL